jgi:hypothetical protein
MRFLLLTFLLFACLSCADKNRTPNMLSRSEFESVYIELLDSASVNAQVPMDSVMSPATNRILRRRGILLSQFTATVLAFNDEPPPTLILVIYVAQLRKDHTTTPTTTGVSCFCRNNRIASSTCFSAIITTSPIPRLNARRMSASGTPPAF